MSIRSPISKFREWKKGDGIVTFHFANMPAGERCAWSCKWATADGLINPVMWAALENMTEQELIAEIEDVIARTGEGKNELEILKATHDPNPVIGFLNTRRENYPEYVLPEDPPHFIHIAKNRPGWDLGKPVKASGIGRRVSYVHSSK